MNPTEEGVVDLNAIKRRCEEATPGPWETRPHSSGWHEVRTMVTMPLPENPELLTVPGMVGNFQREADASFIVAARQDTARLVGELELSNTRLRAIWEWATQAHPSSPSPSSGERENAIEQGKLLVRSLFDPNEAKAFLHGRL